MTTLNNINTIFRNIADSHQQIFDFFIGQDYDIGASKKVNHVLLAINPTSAILPKTDNGYTSQTVDYTIKVIDLVDKDLANQQEVLSDTLSIIKDVVKLLNQNPAYYDSSLNIIGDVNFSTLDGVFDTDVTGWETTFTLEFPAGMGYCGSPIDGVPNPPTDFVTVIDNENPLSPLEFNAGASYTCIGASAQSGIAYARPLPSGQLTSYALYDDVWQQVNNPPPPPPTNPTHTATLLDFLTLVDNNAFGTKERYTNSLGLTATYDGSNGELADYAIDHLTGQGRKLTQITNQGSPGYVWDVILANAHSHSENGFTDWFIDDMQQAQDITDAKLGLNYSPFNNTYVGFFICSTTYKLNTTLFYPFIPDRMNCNSAIGKSFGRDYLLTRWHY